MLAPPWCDQCGMPAASDDHQACARCRRIRPRFERARSGGLYEGALREMVHAFKYANARALAGSLVAVARTAADDVLRGADAVIPVPLHPWRLLRRGFNQADELAVRLGLPVWRALRRTRHGPPQVRLPAARRHANVRGAFVVRSGWRPALHNRVVVLIDDVMTTGATLNACSDVLSEAGVRSVRALTVARAPAPRPERPPPRLHPEAAPRR